MGKGIKEGFMKGVAFELALYVGGILMDGDVGWEKDSRGRGFKHLNPLKRVEGFLYLWDEEILFTKSCERNSVWKLELKTEDPSSQFSNRKIGHRGLWVWTLFSMTPPCCFICS